MEVPTHARTALSPATGASRAPGVGNDSDSNFYGPELSEVESFNGQICLDSVTTEYLN